MKTPVPLRLLAALLGALASASLARADAIDDARTAFAAGDFTTMKSTLDAFLLTTPASDEARLLRALALFGIAAENEVPAFLKTKLGATRAVIDIVADKNESVSDVVFPTTLIYSSTTPWLVSGKTYTLPETSGDVADPSLTFANTSKTAPYTLTLSYEVSGVEDSDSANVNFSIDHDHLGYIYADEFNQSTDSFDERLTFHEDLNRLTLIIPPGNAATIYGLQFGTQTRLTVVGTLPTTVKILNGKRVDDEIPVFDSTANTGDFFKLTADLETSTLAGAIADLAAISAEGSTSLHSDETGHAQDIVIAYPDTQLLLAELKFLQAFRRLSTSYKLTQALTPALFDAELSQIIAKNPTFLSPLAPSSARAADRLLARSLFEQAFDHYQAASDAGLWSRPAPSTGTYLFSTGEDDPEASEDLKETADGAIAQFRTALSGPLSVEIEDGVSANISLAPVFGSPALNVRKILPLSSDHGIIRGTSTPLLTSGLIQDFGTAHWEHFLEESGDLDLVTPARQTGPLIQRQPAALTSVDEGEPATLSVLAECYPAPAYQWYRGSGATAVPIPEATGPTLVFEEVDRDDAGLYTVRVTNTQVLATGPKTTTISSKAGRLYVTYEPEIESTTASLSRYIGKTVTLNVVAVGVPAPRYQWFKGDVAVTPVPRSASKYVFTANAARAGDYKVVVINSKGRVTSDPITVELQTKPVFTDQPDPQTVIVGGSVTFTAAATGNPMPQIKWRKDGKDIPGATGPSYTIDSASLLSRGVYTAVAFSTVNTGPTTTAIVATVSTGAKLTVTPAVAP